YAAASALAEVMLRFAPATAHPESFEVLRQSLATLEVAPPVAVEVIDLCALWRLVSVLGFAPSLEVCVRDGAPVAPSGPIPFSPEEGGALCSRCADQRGAGRLPAQDRADLAALVGSGGDLPVLDPKHAMAHRRLLSRYIRYHLGEGAALPALEFWNGRPWVAQ
ncbi:MAG: DNA repair protein RecO, partial [Gemmatimonadales bacterium]